MLILEYMGGEHLTMTALANSAHSEDDFIRPVKAFEYPPPFNQFLSPIPPEKMIRVPKRYTLQFVVIRPLMTVFELVCWWNGVLDNLLVVIFVNCVYNVSYFY